MLTPQTKETTALGAAFVAGLAVGFWKNFEVGQNAAQPLYVRGRFFPPPLDSDEPLSIMLTSTQELRCIWSVGKKWDPYMPARTRDALIHGWHKAVDRSLGWVEREAEEEEGEDDGGGKERPGSAIGGGAEGPKTAAGAAPDVEGAESPGGRRPKLKRFATMRMKRMDSDARKHGWVKEMRKRLRAVDWSVVGSATVLVVGGLGLGFLLGNRYKLTRV